MRIVVDVAELEQLARQYERSTTELAGVTIDLRRRLGGDLLDRVRAYGLPTRAVGYECERICAALAAHVSEAERMTMDLERVWAEATGLARDGRLAAGAAAPDLWWFRVAGAQAAPEPGSLAFAAASAADATPAAAPAADLMATPVAGVVLTGAAGSRPSDFMHATPGTWEEIDRYLLSLGIDINTPPENWQTTGGRHSPTSYHYRSRARDYSYGMGCNETAIATALRPFCGAGIVELFHAPTNTWYPSNVGAHQDHIHAAIAENFRFPS